MLLSSLVYPMFAMVLLTVVVLGILFRSRVRAVRSNQVTMKYFRTFQGEVEPESTAKPARHFSNLFEAPMLFYAACLAAMLTRQTGLTIVLLAWAYVVLRIIHAWIHLGGNRVRYRMRAYFAGWVVLLALWIAVVAGVAFSGA
ncbi:MAG: MAPEG family protein [Gammaproteobacteria bacterium]